MPVFHRYVKILLNTLAVFILSYVTLAAAAEFMVDQTENVFAVSGKTITIADIYKGDIIRVHNEDLVLQNALFPGAGGILNIAANSQDHARIFAFDGAGKLQVECGIHPQASGNTAFN